MRAPVRGVLAALLLAGLAAAPAGAQGLVSGRVTLDLPGTALADLGPVVVYLAREAALEKAPKGSASMRQKGAHFVPGFLAVAAGQSVAMPNDDTIFHNVFSYSKPNDFDLGLYPGGESRSVPMRHPGVVKLYCSIHESMRGVIFVAPTPWFATAHADGRFELRDVPPGRHRLRTWNERLPDTERAIEVPASGGVTVEISLVP